ncbi:MAG: methionine--tRNA ligase [Bacteroidota bacterium]|nr:methionine--tRNA ligase [Bacteroidota bacterium]
MKDFKRYMVTSALPYANGPVHLGHIAGVYLPSDIYVRYLRLMKKDVLWVCGSDEHGVPITLKAKKEGKSPQDIVDRYHNIIKKAFEDFGISTDIYSRTTSEMHYKTAQEFFKTLNDKGVFSKKTSKQFFDPEEKMFLADRYLSGTCPHCDHEGAYGDQCENCGTSLNAEDLKNPVSQLSGATPELRETEHWYLPLDEYEPFLKKWILEDHKEWKNTVSGQCRSWFEIGLQPRAVSRDLNWGVPLPVENSEGKVMYVWFDAPIGYISATREHTADWEKYWKDEDTKLVHFIGKDNIVFHSIIFPVMLKAEGSYILPDNVPANQFLNLEGDKISTSRNWAVWLHEYLEEFKGKQDELRYVLAANMPEAKDNDFRWKDYQDKINNELVAVLGNFVNRALVLTQKYYDNIVPECDCTPEDDAIFEQIKTAQQKISDKIEHFRFRDALKEMMDVARLGNKYLADTEPWKLIKTNPERVKTIMNVALQTVASLSVLAEPFLPFTTKRLQKMLNIDAPGWTNAGAKNIMVPGHQTAKAELLFEKVEDEVVEQQVRKLLKTKENNKASEKPQVTPMKKEITFEDFLKSDIRVGVIKSAEKVKKTKKLLAVEVDTGVDTRTVISGIAEHYTPEEIIGKRVVILINLAPKKMRGIESAGMILMGEDADGKLTFISPEDDFHAGATIS